MPKRKKSIFERITGSAAAENDFADFDEATEDSLSERDDRWIDDEASNDAQLTVDVYQDADNIYIKTIVAGVEPDDLDVQITRDTVVIHGTREHRSELTEDDYFHRELFWGSFSRTILLPEEVDTDGAEAEERNGLLTITLPKIDKKRQTKLRIKSK